VTDVGPGTALVTGASAGIGRELALLLAAGGHRLLLTARDAARLESLAGELERRWGTTSVVVPCDLSTPEGPGRLAQALADYEIDVLVNNAGMGASGPFSDVSPTRIAALLQLNIVSLTALTRLLLPGMLARRRGRILNLASTAAFQPGPWHAIYYASKAYVLSLSEAIAVEVEGNGVTVTTLCPGPTETEFFSRARMRHSPLARRGLMDAATVARAGYEGMMAGERVVIPGARNRVLAALGRHAPRGLVTGVVARLNRGRKRSGADPAAGGERAEKD
jgi:short-subunit dehydrogenase